MLKQEFPLNDGLAYLNHAAVGVWPRRTCAAVRAFAEENMRQGAADYPGWMQVERELRGRLQRLLNADSGDDIALVKNTSEGLSLIAYGLDWRAGDNVVISNLEFPSNRIVWESLAGLGVELRAADISGDDPEEAVLRLVDADTRLVSLSWVQFAGGLRLDVEKIGRYCRRQGVLFCIDAIQGLGALAFDAQRACADFVVADGHKWMLGPEGLAVFYGTPHARHQLALRQYGWHMVERAGDFDAADWQPASSARRFEPGSPNMLGIHALNASLSLLEDVGMTQVEARLMQRVQWLLDAARASGKTTLLSPADAGRRSGIVSLRRADLDDAEHAALYRHLMSEGVVCALRDGGIRFSPHFYTPEHALKRAFHAFESWPG